MFWRILITTWDWVRPPPPWLGQNPKYRQKSVLKAPLSLGTGQRLPGPDLPPTEGSSTHQLQPTVSHLSPLAIVDNNSISGNLNETSQATDQTRPDQREEGHLGMRICSIMIIVVLNYCVRCQELHWSRCSDLKQLICHWEWAKFTEHIVYFRLLVLQIID